MQRYVETHGGDISSLFIVLNTLLSDKDSSLGTVGETPVRLADGSYYQLFTYIGRYYVDKASFRHYPFMNISLPVVIEANDIDGELGYRDLRLIPEIRNSGMGLYARIIGWLNTGWSIAEYRHHYATNLGLVAKKMIIVRSSLRFPMAPLRGRLSGGCYCHSLY
jgi:hypothetical protein